MLELRGNEKGVAMQWLKVIMVLVMVSGLAEAKVSLMHGTTAKTILEKAYRFLEEQPAFSLEALTISEDSFKGKMVIEVHTHLKVALDRQGKIRVDVDGDSKQRSYLLKKGEFLAWDRTLNLYGKLKTPVGNDKALDYLFDKYGIAAPLANLLYSDLRKRLMPQARGYYFGMRKLRGHWCHYLGFVNQQKEFQVWVRAEGAPLIERFVIIDKTTKLRLHSATDLTWSSLGQVEGDPFTLNLPPDARRIPIEPAEERGGIR